MQQLQFTADESMATCGAQNDITRPAAPVLPAPRTQHLVRTGICLPQVFLTDSTTRPAVAYSKGGGGALPFEATALGPFLPWLVS